MAKQTEYIVKYGINKEELARYLLIARGDRTMKEFVSICSKTMEAWKKEGLLDPSVKAGVSESTFSRIAKGARYGEEGIKRPLSEAIMKAIYENAADQSKIELNLFMASNGMVKVDKKGNVVDDPLDDGKRSLAGIRRRKAREKREEDVRTIIEDEYNIRGRNIRVFSNGEYKEPYLVQAKTAFPDAMPDSTHSLRWTRGHFAIRVEDEETPVIHNFIIDFDYNNFDELEQRIKDARIIKYEFIDDFSKLFLRDMWEPKDFQEVMHTIIFTSEDRYDAFVDLFNDLCVNNNFSAILVNQDKHIIEKEEGLTRYDGKKAPLITSSEIKEKTNTLTDYSDFMVDAHDDDED